jgi:hypothetical protein
MKRFYFLLVAALLLLLIPMAASGASPVFNHWSSNGPFKTGVGNRVITALAVAPDGKTVYAGTGSGSVFSYAVTAPTATTNAATTVTASGATLNGTVNPLNASGEVTFEYGTTIGYGSVVDAANPNHDVSGSIDINPAITIGGLLPNTLYHFRVVIETTSGKTYGSDQTFTTLKLDQTITFTPLGNKTYGDLPFTVSASSDSLLTVSFTSQTTTECTVSGTTVTIHKFGTCTIAADQGGNSTYYPAPQVLQSFTVNKALLTVTPDNQSRLYGQSNPAFPVTITGYVYGENATSAGVSGSASGSCTATATSPVAGVYVITGSTGTLAATNYTFAAANGVLTINKAHLTVTADDKTREYGKVNPVFTTTITGFVNGEDASVASANVTGSATGSSTATVTSPAGATYTITGSTGDLAAANYDFIAANGTLTITKASQTINFGSVPITKTYGAADFGPGAVASSGLPVTYGIDIAAVGTITPGGLVHINGAGNAIITATQAGDGNYLPATASQGLVVDKATLMVQANNASRPAGVANPTFTASYSGFVNSETDAVLSGTPGFLTPADLASAAGEYPILPLAGTLASANYSFTFFPGILAVDLQSQTITFNQLPTKTYGDAPFTISATSSSANPIILQSTNLSVATIAGNTVTIVGPGSALITATQAGTPTHASAIAMQFLTVEKATLTVAADNASKLFGNPNPLFTYTTTGFVAPDNLLTACSGAPDLTTSALLASPVGSYPITTAAGTLSCAKYNTVFVNGVLGVGITSQNITFAPLAPVTYGDASFALSATGGGSGNPVTFSSSNPAVATVSGATVTIIGAGSTTILANQAGTNSYAPASAQQILTVRKKNLTVTADAKMREYNTANPSLTVTYGAFAYSEDQTVLAGTHQLSTTATISSDVGTYPIQIAAGNLSATNYDITYADGTLTINKATPVITWSNPAPINFGTPLGATQLNATTTVPGVISYKPGSGFVLGVGANQPLSAGFTPSDTTNYNSAKASVTITVNKGTQSISFPPATKTYGDSPIDLNTLVTVSNSPPRALIKAVRLPVLPRVTFTLVSGPGTLSGTNNATLTINGAGAIVVKASIAEDSEYTGATAQQTILVNKAAGTVTLGNLNHSYDGTAKFATATATPGGLGIDISYSDASGNPVAAPTAAGSYGVIAAISDLHYQGSASGTLVIAKMSQTIAFPPLTGQLMGAADLDPVATASSALSVSYASGNTAVATIVAGKIHLVGPGTTTITATQAGNDTYAAATSVSQTLTVAYSTTTPVLRLSTLPDGSTTNNATLNVAGTASAFNGLDKVTINGTPTSVAGDGSFSAAVSLQQGGNTITTIALDKGGLKAEDSRIITLDTTAPAVTVTTPADNSATATALTSVTGTLDDANATVSVTINGGEPQAAAITERTFSASVTLVNGLNTIEITARDLLGNSSVTKRTVTLDTIAPALAISNPGADLTTTLGTFTIIGQASDSQTMVTLTLTMDGQSYTPTVAGGNFFQTLSFPTEKSYAISVTATDAAGNSTTVQRNIIYQAPANGQQAGDTNGDGTVDISDAIQVLRAAIGLVPVTPEMLRFGDLAPMVNGQSVPDGVIDIADAIVILERIVGLVRF